MFKGKFIFLYDRRYLDKGNILMQELNQHDAKKEPLITPNSIIGIQSSVDQENYLINKVYKGVKYPCQY